MENQRERGAGPRAGAVLVFLLSLLAASCAGPAGPDAAVQDPDEPPRAVLQQALFQANELVVPSRGRRVTYDTARRGVAIAFTTPPDHVVDFSDFWSRWRLNQWRVLAVMDRAGVPVEWLTVETNHTDGSGRVRVTSPAAVVRDHARGDVAAWRAGSRVEQRTAGGGPWTVVEP